MRNREGAPEPKVTPPDVRARLFPMVKRALVLGHRGYSALYPENTLLAFRKAIEAGADGLECDLQKTVDGRYVVIHDHTTDRAAGFAGIVDRMTLAELQRLDLGRGERIPELAELLAALPSDAFLDLELKSDTLSPLDSASIASILHGRIDRRRLMISSFSPRLLAPFRRLGYPVGLLIHEQVASLGLLPMLVLLLLVRPRFANLPVRMVRNLGQRRTRLILHLLRSFGFSFLFWTVNSAAEAGAVRGFADFLVTDQVEALRRAPV